MCANAYPLEKSSFLTVPSSNLDEFRKFAGQSWLDHLVLATPVIEEEGAACGVVFPGGPKAASPLGGIDNDVGVFQTVSPSSIPRASDRSRWICSLSACAIGLRRVPPKVLIVPRPFPAKAVPKARCTSITTPTIA